MTTGIEPQLVGAAVKSFGELAAKAGAGARLVPRLDVHGDGTGSIIAFNLRVANVGKEVAYGIRLSVAARFLNAAPGAEPDGDWWRWDSGLRNWLLHKLWPRIPESLARWLWGRLSCSSEDVGFILAPGEAEEVYFGQIAIRGDGVTRYGKHFMSWRPGSIIELTVKWFEGPPRPWSIPHSMRTKLAIHTGVETTCAHTRWSTPKADSGS